MSIPVVRRLLDLTSFLADVGGGHHSDFDTASASYIPLRWMIKEALLHTSIIFKAKDLAYYGLVLPTDVSSPKTTIKPRSDAEVAAGYYDNTSNAAGVPRSRAKDVQAPLHDTLHATPMWWLLELLPILERKQARNGEWIWNVRYVSVSSLFFSQAHLDVNLLRVNFFRSRTIPRPAPSEGGMDPEFTALIHKSVLERQSRGDHSVTNGRAKSLHPKKERYQPYALHDEITPVWVE